MRVPCWPGGLTTHLQIPAHLQYPSTGIVACLHLWGWGGEREESTVAPWQERPAGGELSAQHLPGESALLGNEWLQKTNRTKTL